MCRYRRRRGCFFARWVVVFRSKNAQALVILLRRLAFGSRPALHFYWNVLPSITPAVCRTAPNRTACGMLHFYSARVGIAIRTFSNVVRLSNFVGSLGAYAFPWAIPTKSEKTRKHGERSQRRDVNTFLRNHIGLVMLSAGSTLGAARPQTCAKESLTLWTLFRGRPSGKVRFTRG